MDAVQVIRGAERVREKERRKGGWLNLLVFKYVSCGVFCFHSLPAIYKNRTSFAYKRKQQNERGEKESEESGGGGVAINKTSTKNRCILSGAAHRDAQCTL